jgi:hypothetical protein
MAGFADSHSSERRPSGKDSSPWASRPSGDPSTPGAERSGSGEVWSRYHCPVCGHQDGVTLREPVTHIQCSHCETPLEVHLRTPTSESASVRVEVDTREH